MKEDSIKDNPIHASREGFRGAICECQVANLRDGLEDVLQCRVSQDDLQYLVSAVCTARAELRRAETALSTRKKTLSQLKRMLKLPDLSIIDALRCCDARTLAVVEEAQMDVMWKAIQEQGFYLHSTRGPQYATPAPPILWALDHPKTPVELPQGLEGLRASILSAIEKLEAQKDSSGRNPTLYSLSLAAECVRIWRKYRPKDSAKAWQVDGDARSGVVRLAELVFGVFRHEKDAPEAQPQTTLPGLTPANLVRILKMV